MDGPATSGTWGTTDFSNRWRRELVTFVSEHFRQILSSRGGSWSICELAESCQNTMLQHFPSRLSSFTTLLLHDKATSRLGYFMTQLLRNFSHVTYNPHHSHTLPSLHSWPSLFVVSTLRDVFNFVMTSFFAAGLFYT